MPDENKIDPKNYASYEEYQEALRVHEEFMKRSVAVSKVMQSAKTDEEMIQGMKALGFQYYDDEE